MKTLFILLISFSNIYSGAKNQLLNTEFNRDHCEDWRTLRFTENKRYELTESMMAGPPWRTIGQYEIKGNEVELRPKSCKILLEIKTKEDQEIAKIHESRCEYALRQAACIFRTIKNRDFSKELTCTELASESSQPTAEKRIFRFRNFKRKEGTLRNCVIPYPKDE